jgi:putative oxidoreductase
MTSAVQNYSHAINIGIWVLRVLLGLAFLFAGYIKLIGKPHMIAEFDTLGLGQWFRYFTGAVELIGGLVILIPRISVFGAVLLLIIDIGAFVAQVTILHMGWIHCVVVGALLALLIYLEPSALLAFTG